MQKQIKDDACHCLVVWVLPVPMPVKSEQLQCVSLQSGNDVVVIARGPFCEAADYWTLYSNEWIISRRATGAVLVSAFNASSLMV